MANSVRVTRVTVQFKAQGKSFTVAFDPSKVKGIVFDGQFQKAVETAAFQPNPAPPQFFGAAKGIPATVGGHSTQVHAAADKTLEESSAALWWVNDQGVWFHPEDRT